MIRPETATARKLRGSMPPAERLLWSRLRRSAIGHRFRRQHPIGPYVADFCCMASRVVVEVDGGSHFENDAAMAYDAIRGRFIEEAGFLIVRVTNTDVKTRMESVLDGIGAACEEGIARRR